MIRGITLFTPRPEVTGAQLAAVLGVEFTPAGDDAVTGTVDGCEIRLLRTAAFPTPWPVQLEVTVPSVAAVIDRCRELGVAMHGDDQRVLVEVEGRIDIVCVPVRPASEDELTVETRKR